MRRSPRHRLILGHVTSLLQPSTAPDSDICRRLEAAQVTLERSLAARGVASMVAGAILVSRDVITETRLGGRKGRQHLARGGVDS